MTTMQDSIFHTDNIHVPSGDSVAHVYSPRTPYQVLRMLPADATPEQQDSAIQANFRPAEIHYSGCPDTLHIPGHKVSRPAKFEDMPVYYKETFFSKDSMFQAEYRGIRNGVPGVAMPYSMRTDPYITVILLACILISTLTVNKISHFILYRCKTLFYNSPTRSTEKETTNEVYAQLMLNMMCAMLTSFFMFSCAEHFISDTYILPTQYHLMGILLVMILGYKLFKAIAYFMVNTLFWGGKRNLHYIKDNMFLGSIESLLLLVMVMIQIYFELHVIYTVFCFVFIQIIVKLLTFYKCYVIFFNQRGGYFHFFLYLCALEIAPLAVLWTAVFRAVNILKVNF